MTDNFATGLLSVCCALALVAATTGGVAGTSVATQQSDEGPSLERAPVEFTALGSGHQHIEVLFRNSIDTDRYDFTVRNATGHVVADPELNGWFSDPSEGYVWLELGDTDLQRDDLVLSLDERDGDDRYEYALTTTDGFVQHDYPEDSDTSVAPGEAFAVINLPGRDPVDVGYSVVNGAGETVTEGSTGSETFTSLLDVSALDPGESYAVAFDNPGETAPLTVETSAPADDGDPGMPGYIESRTVESINDEKGYQEGTTISFPYDQGYSIGRVEVVLNSTEHLGDEMTLDQLDRLPASGVQSTSGEVYYPAEPPGEVLSLYNCYIDEGTEPTTLRVPVYMGRIDYDREDLKLLHYRDGAWHDLNATVVADERFSGYHRLILEGDANSTSLFAVVAES